MANQLVMAGRNATVDAVREAMDGTGSKGTLAPLLKRWKTEHGATDVELTSRLPAPLLQAVVALHEQVKADAELPPDLRLWCRSAIASRSSWMP